MITDTMNSPLYKKAFGAKDPFVAEKQKKKVAAFKVANEISDSEYNWQTDYTPGRDETEYFCTYRKCGLCAFGRKYGHPELIKHMCQMDYISIDMMGGVLYRTKTLATGGDCCDFHVVKKVRNGLKNRIEIYQYYELIGNLTNHTYIKSNNLYEDYGKGS